MRELIIAFGLFLFIEGILYAIFPSKMKSMLKKLEFIKESQLRLGGLIGKEKHPLKYLVVRKRIKNGGAPVNLVYGEDVSAAVKIFNR